VDIVKTQIMVAQGLPLSDDAIGLGSQDAIKTDGFALQCRITTEDPTNNPTNNFMPDYGRVVHYRSPGGAGVRLDAGSAFSGAVVNPFYDSMLVKLSVRGSRFADAIQRAKRCFWIIPPLRTGTARLDSSIRRLTSSIFQFDRIALQNC